MRFENNMGGLHDQGWDAVQFLREAFEKGKESEIENAEDIFYLLEEALGDYDLALAELKSYHIR